MRADDLKAETVKDESVSIRLSGTKLRMSTAYHPQSEGQTEVLNKLLQQYLRCFIQENPKQWGRFLHLAEWHYNTATHSSSGITPFQVVYGRSPPSLPLYISGTSHIQAVDDELTSREDMLCLLRNKLLKAQNTMKLQADRKRGHRIQKLSKRFFGPFKIIRQIGDVAFELELPASSKIHPVFHVSKLKLSYTTPSNIPAF
ncbi:hypothetical protein A2U01_0003756 [Trifolium medium]|uniref:Integrase catalytic domain-containing protein n=1 Tax=Trifolium medium TaxID=97028 RepID=A0A392M721_9FABA|nr:hypothetical protein [Trifolium medium]